MSLDANDTKNGAAGRSPFLSGAQANEAARMAVLAALTYKPNIATYARRLGYDIECIKSQQQTVFIFTSPKEIIVTFKGSELEKADQQWQNFAFRATPWLFNAPTDNSATDSPIREPFGTVHAGFYKRAHEPVLQSDHDATLLGTPIIDAVHTRLKAACTSYKQADLRLLGYSSGGAIAVLQAAYLAQKEGSVGASRVKSITSFGAPRVGYPNFFAAFSQYYGDRYQRFALEGDPVPHMPPRSYLNRIPNFGYIDGTDTITLPKPAPLPARTRREAEPEEGWHPIRSKMKDLKNQFGAQIGERHGIHNYLRACTSHMGVSKQKFLRDLYHFSAQHEEADISYLPPFDETLVNTSAHLITLLQYAGSGRLMGAKLPSLMRQSAELQTALRSAPLNLLTSLERVSRASAAILDPMNSDPDLRHLAEYCDYIALEAIHMQDKARDQLGQLAHYATSSRFIPDMSADDLPLIRQAGNNIKAWLQRNTQDYAALASPLDLLFKKLPTSNGYAQLASGALSSIQGNYRGRG